MARDIAIWPPPAYGPRIAPPAEPQPRTWLGETSEDLEPLYCDVGGHHFRYGNVTRTAKGISCDDCLQEDEMERSRR